MAEYEARFARVGSDEVRRILVAAVRPDCVPIESELRRMAHSLGRIPACESSADVLLDIGGTYQWPVLYRNVLGYETVCIVNKREWVNLERLRDGALDGVTLRTIDLVADIDPFPLAGETVAHVVAFEILEHLIGDPMHMIAEANRVLRPGGTLTMSTPNAIAGRNVLHAAFGLHPYSWSAYTCHYGDRHNREFTPFEVRKVMEAGGFRVANLETVDFDARGAAARWAGSLFCVPAWLSGRVPMRLRNQTIVCHGVKTAPPASRYPPFLYDMYGTESINMARWTARVDDATGGG